MSGVAAPTGNYTKDIQNTMKTVLLDLQRRNPGAKPAAILAAAQQEVGLMKGLAPEDKIAAQTQFQLAEINQRYAESELKHQDAETKMADTIKAIEEKLAVATANYDKLMASKAADRDNKLDVQDAKNQGGLAIQDKRNQGGLAIQDKRNTGGLAIQDDKNTGSINLQNAKAPTQLDVARTNADARIRGAVATQSGRDPGPRNVGGGQPPAAASTPPASALQEKVHTTFANGQVWTLVNGKPVQVK